LPVFYGPDKNVRPPDLADKNVRPPDIASVAGYITRKGASVRSLEPHSDPPGAQAPDDRKPSG
jgi:hypothetical protein